MLGKTRVTDAGLHALAELESLQRLYLYTDAISDAGLTALGKLTHLTVLDLEQTQVGDASAPFFAAQPLARARPAAHEGRRRDHPGAGEQADVAARCTSIKPPLVMARSRRCRPCRSSSSWLSYSSVRTTTLEQLSAIETLEVLSVAGLPIDDAGLAPAARLVRLRQLDLGETKVAGNGLTALARAALALRVLNLALTNVAGEALAALAPLQLVELRLATTHVDDKALAKLPPLVSLSTLILDGTPVGDAGVAELVRLPRLSDLGLQATQIGDPALGTLGRLTLQRLDLRHTRITRAGAMRLQRQLHCEVQWGGRPIKRGDFWMP